MPMTSERAMIFTLIPYAHAHTKMPLHRAYRAFTSIETRICGSACILAADSFSGVCMCECVRARSGRSTRFIRSNQRSRVCVCVSVFSIFNAHEQHSVNTHKHAPRAEPAGAPSLLFMDPFHCFSVLHKLGIIAFECVRLSLRRANARVYVLYEQNMYI